VLAQPSAALKITFDFLDGKGNVVATEKQELPAFEAGASQGFNVKVEQAGVAALRYKRG